MVVLHQSLEHAHILPPAKNCRTRSTESEHLQAFPGMSRSDIRRGSEAGVKPGPRVRLHVRMSWSRPKHSSRVSRLAALRASDGFSLIELLTAMALTVVVMAASGTVLGKFQASSNSDAENSQAQAEATASVDRMVRELRQGVDVLTQTGSQMTVQLLDGTQLSYKCDTADPNNSALKACYRLTAAAGATLPTPTAAMAKVYRIANPVAKPVFTYTLPVIDDANDADDEASDAGNTPDPPSPVYVALHFEFPSKGELAVGGRTRTIILDSGFEMRNVRYAQSGGTDHEFP